MPLKELRQAPQRTATGRVTKKAAQSKTPSSKHIKELGKRVEINKTPSYMHPLQRVVKEGKRLHEKKKNGECRKDCRQCKEETFHRDALEDPNHCFHELYVCRNKGRNGSPTLDRAGYELDYDKVAAWFKPTSRSSLKPTMSKIQKFDESVERQKSENRQIVELFFEDSAAPQVESTYSETIDAIKERVEKDIGVPWHKVGVEEVREWEKKGFAKAKAGEYVEFTKQDKERFSRLHEGCVLRK